MTDIFLNGKADEAYAVYTPASRHEPIAEKILNIENKKEGHVEYITEPDVQGLISELIPLYISAKVRLILLRAFSAENAARAIAMHEATDNAKDLVDSLVLLRNKIRQANITEEIIEIISSVNAMKG